MLGFGLVDQGLKTAGTRITLDLPIPDLRLVFLKPRSKFHQFMARQVHNCIFDLFY